MAALITDLEDNMPFGDPLSGGGVEGGFGGALYGMGNAATKKIGGLFGGLQKRPGLAQPGQQPLVAKASVDPYGSQRGLGEASSPSGGDFTPAPSIAAAPAVAPKIQAPSAAPAVAPKIQAPVETSAKQSGAEMHPLLADALKNRSMWRDTPGSSYTQPTVSAPLLTLDSTWGGLDSMMNGAPTNKWVSLGQASSGGGGMSRGPAGAPGANMAKGVEAQAAIEHARSGGMPTAPESIKLFQEAQNLKAKNPDIPIHERLMSDPQAEIGSFARALAADKIQEGSPEWIAKMQGFMASRKTNPQEIKKANEPRSFGWSSEAGGSLGLGGLQFSQGQTPESKENMSVLQKIQQLMQKSNGPGAGVP